MSLSGPARHLDDRDAARRPPADPHARRRVRRGARQAGARARAGARRPVLLPPQPRRVDRGGRGRSSSSSAPSLRFIVAHGQMRERELEEKMHAFLRGDADVLVSTTIIESGLDIPQANTLIVERADTLGLAQLYQIRGRVGRSRRHRARVPLLSRRARADAGGARAARDARRPHRARRRLRDRDARPRDPRRRRPARRRAVRPRRRGRLRALRRAARTRRSPSCRASGALAPPGARRRARRRLRPGARTSPPRR